MIMKALLVLFATLALGHSTKVRYDNFEVYRIYPQNEEQLNALREIEGHPSYSLWNDITHINKNVDVMVAPHLRNQFRDFLCGFNYRVWIQDVQKLIDAEEGPSEKATRDLNFRQYNDLDTIYDWMRNLAETYPEVTLVEGGRSYENRPILGVKVSFKPGNKIVFLEGGIHAREWIAPATVTYILDQLLTSTDPAVRSLAESRDWYVFPLVNPDGYEFSRIEDRLWRKTRKPYTKLCFGADANRNWGYHWNDGGSTTFICADTFAGKEAFSEIETKTLSEYITTIADDLEAYIGFHSYSQFLLIPFGHKGLEVPANNKELHHLGNVAKDAIAKRYGTEYVVGNVPEVIYVASGGSFDWVLGTFRHVKLAYTFELRDQGQSGFLLPPSQIIPTGEETLDGLVALFKEYDASNK
ncbi:hypothetical protein FQA39_LY11512 [Lamprigera yunnana]|nr:hypothetical protein FQA39_LY11512 [Lamprigera yunnana]